MKIKDGLEIKRMMVEVEDKIGRKKEDVIEDEPAKQPE